ncbi:MAG TPA: 16S rRNA (cytosine(1402)-N(4))-methyltransferase RsmH [Phycisphaerae bacterium]|nr:16S rRNA (cytosine(1402)-N(4))-methyltransferase RsmH [Phycisphaerae bacterium]
MDIQHEPVLCDALMTQIALRPGEVVVDATLGHGGHAALMAAALGERGRLIGLDVDPANLDRAGRRLEAARAAGGSPFQCFQANFAELDRVLDQAAADRVDAILADLGPSTDQMLDASRGLTFLEDGPLDMRLDPDLKTTAADLVNSLSEGELSDLLWNYSQERFSRRIARRICHARREGRIRRTPELVRIVCGAVGLSADSHRYKIHPATRTFLALRMAVNHEPDNLGALLRAAPRRLREGGRLAIISFHSGEDRLVKQDFLDRQAQGVYEIRTRKPVRASSEEIQRNPRSRSAKLRVAARTSGAWRGP